MKITSLNAECGENFIEIGRYGMSLEEAKKAFLKAVEDNGNKVKSETIHGNRVVFLLEFNWDLNYKLMEMLAKIGNIHGDPAGQYFLKEVDEVLPGEYVKTGTWSD